MKNASKNKQHGSVHLVIIVIAAIVLLGSVGLLFWNNFFKAKTDNTIQSTSSKKESVISKGTQSHKGYNKPSDWLTYSDSDLPYVFDYPSTIKFTKEKYISDGTGKSFTPPKGYTRVTLSSGEESTAEIPLSLSYEIGNSGFSEGASVCGYDAKATFTNELVNNGKITGCKIGKEWEYKEVQLKTNKPTRLKVFSSEDVELNMAIFKKIVESFRRK